MFLTSFQVSLAREVVFYFTGQLSLAREVCPLLHWALAREVPLGPWNLFSIPPGLLLHRAGFDLSLISAF